MKWFYDFEQEKYVSETQLKAEYESLKAEDPEQYNYSFQHFINNCLSINNGSLHTLENHKKELLQLLKFYKEEPIIFKIDIWTISDELEYLEKLMKEGK